VPYPDYLAGLETASADLDPVSYLSSSCRYMNLNGKYGDFIVKLMGFLGKKTKGRFQNLLFFKKQLKTLR
jgi:hypothetical protein